jgi:hypothetical protein
VHYHLQAEAEPDSLCRVLNLFALQFLTPHSVQVSQWTTCWTSDRYRRPELAPRRSDRAETA